MTNLSRARERVASIVAQAVNMALAGAGSPGRLHETSDGATETADRIIRALDGLGRGDEPEGWRPIESAPMNEPAEFCPPLRNCYGEMEQRFRGKFGCWSSLYKATHWRPLPKPPEPKP